MQGKVLELHLLSRQLGIGYVFSPKKHLFLCILQFLTNIVFKQNPFMLLSSIDE